MKNERIEIVNRQRKVKFNTEDFRGFVENATSEVSEAAERSLTIAFVSDAKMCELNRTFRSKNSTTDVLSFNAEPDEFAEEDDYLGDIVISLEQARRQAHENNLDFEMEIKQLILHGILHLCGYDHETDNGEMNGVELGLRDKLGIN